MTEHLYCPKWAAISMRIILLIIPLATTAILLFGNPQWNKNIYLFQAYIYPKAEEGWIEPPDDYSGRWVIWVPDGRKWLECEYINGLRNGRYLQWTIRGQDSESGDLFLTEEFYRSGLLHGPRTLWDWEGQLIRTDWYFDDVEVTLPEFLERAPSDEIPSEWREYMRYDPDEEPGNRSIPMPSGLSE